jgi:hypothetical protein
MKSDEFVIWLRGFTQACHHLTATPAQWEKIIQTLETVELKNEKEQTNLIYETKRNTNETE